MVAALRDDIIAMDPDLVVVSGDLTQRARKDEFRKARAFLDALPFPQLVVPGNHDIPLDNPLLRFADPYGRFMRHVTREPRPLFRDEEMIVLGLDTTRPSLWKEGRLSAEQIARIREVFCDAPPQVFRVLVTHHPFLPPEGSPGQTLVGRADRALAMMQACGAELLLAGHLHLGYHGDVRRHHVKVSRSILVAQAGTAVSHRTRGEPNAYNLLRLDWPRVEIDVREGGDGPFRSRASACYQAGAEGWVTSR